MGTVVFYHYTSKESAEHIRRSGYIRASPYGAFGPGVYGTTISPEEGRKRVAQNNWDDMAMWQTMEIQGRVDCAFKIILPANKVKRARSGRDILIHDGDIRLSDYPSTVVEYKDPREQWNCCQIL